MAPRVSKATQTVLDARALYVKRLHETIGEYGSPPYMQQRVDSRTADRNLAMTTPEQMAQMAMTNPAMAEQASARIEQLRQRAEANPPPFSAPGEYEPK